MAKIVIDAGHGGTDPGAVYQGRQEKEDVLRLALELGEILKQNGIEVVYTRTNDIYQTPYQKAVSGNNSNADIFVSLHRNASVSPGSGEGIETLVYADEGLPADLAKNINAELESIGFVNRGVTERPGLVVLRRTKMPAILVEAGFIDNESDNQKFDDNFERIAEGIADGILRTLDVKQESTSEDNATILSNQLPMQNMSSQNMSSQNQSTVPMMPPQNQNPFPMMPPQNQNQPMLYRVQVGAYKNKRLANSLLFQLQREGYPAFLLYEDGLYKVQVGAFVSLDNAIRMERMLRMAGYNTWITT